MNQSCNYITKGQDIIGYLLEKEKHDWFILVAKFKLRSLY